jgi:predicted XRE-type DNA-binding protein
MNRRGKAGRRAGGTDNVLVDLGFDDAEGLSARTTLALKINQLLDEKGLTQADASQLLGMPQPKISAIRNYKLQGFSLERLMCALTALGQHVQISVTPRTKRSAARISVAA